VKKCTYCGKEYSDEVTVCELDAQRLIGPDGSSLPLPNEVHKVPKAAPSYVILPDGRIRFLKATFRDILLSVVIPPVGFLVGFFAFTLKGEKRRGATMMILAFCVSGPWFLLTLLMHPHGTAGIR
jgi:hypothetical protein